MPVLHVNDQQYPLKPGATRIGAADAADVPVPGAPGVQAIVDVQQGQGIAIRRAASDAAVRVNGVALGAEPMPLLHGDRIEVAGVELRFADDQKGGATAFVTADQVAAMAARRGPAMATSGTGGRLVSLVDGKEYQVPVTGLVIGREVGADVVVPLAEVSRRHAEIVPTSEGYRLTDLSTNGVLVNGERVVQSRLLNRADVIRVGTEEFRFYADVAKPAPSAPPSEPAAATPVTPAAPAAAPAAAAPAAAAPAAAAAARPVAQREAPAPPVEVPAGHPVATKPGAGRRQVAPALPEAAPARTGSPLWIWVLIIIVVVVVAALLVMG